MSSPASEAFPSARPVLKWVGGKRRLLKTITPHFCPETHTRVVEPFFGGGALAFDLASQHPRLEVVANEKIRPVVDIYEAIRGDVDAFLDEVAEFAVPYVACEGKDARREFYYGVRERYMLGDLDGPAALFFMLWSCYSGLYRTSKTYPGRFNTPHGMGQEKSEWYSPANVRAAAELMGSWTFTSDDFAATLPHVDASTFVFLDPPYRETYTGYTADGFTAEDQDRVVAYARAAAELGATVVYTNKDLGDGWYEEQLPDFTIDRAAIRYQVNGDNARNGRPQSHEVICTNAGA